ncbi:hypothetical protein E4U60_000969 [Claviceps pazoutovae]|uniref:Uncharacterized protein n=1 Tax=Claviceps pazoutovae TaxID=1649127 RepID=A0A9P7SHT3_9HYPO|nr:hypothetical protein E4U60_000969 [Claviceps pazoutovae]
MDAVVWTKLLQLATPFPAVLDGPSGTWGLVGRMTVPVRASVRRILQRAKEQGTPVRSDLFNSRFASTNVVLDPELSLHEWISALKDALWVDDLSEKKQARERYHEALEQPMQKPQHWSVWLAEYNETASLAKLHGIPEVLQIHALMKDFRPQWQM